MIGIQSVYHPFPHEVTILGGQNRKCINIKDHFRQKKKHNKKIRGERNWQGLPVKVTYEVRIK